MRIETYVNHLLKAFENSLGVNMVFENILYVYAVLLFPVFYVLFILYKRWVKKSLKKIADANIIYLLLPDLSFLKKDFKFLIIILALFGLWIGILNPQVGSKLEEVKRKGVDIVIAMDLSNSMMAEDLTPNRLEKAKYAISKLIEKLHNDRIGLIVFAGEAYVQLPLTTDYAAAKMFLSTINTQIIPIQGTAIGAAIKEAMESFGDENEHSKAIIVITDGENHEDDALKQAELATKEEITVYTIGMGLPEGAPIPIYSGNRLLGYRKDKEGTTVISKLNEPYLQQIALSGNGTYVRASNTQVGLDILLEEINKLEKSEYGSKLYTDYEDKFQYFLAFALFLMIIEVFVNERKSKWLEKLDLFGENKKTR